VLNDRGRPRARRSGARGVKLAPMEERRATSPERRRDRPATRRTRRGIPIARRGPRPGWLGRRRRTGSGGPPAMIRAWRGSRLCDRGSPGRARPPRHRDRARRTPPRRDRSGQTWRPSRAESRRGRACSHPASRVAQRRGRRLECGQHEPIRHAGSIAAPPSRLTAHGDGQTPSSDDSPRRATARC